MSESLAEHRSVLERTPAERADAGIGHDEVEDALVAVMNRGDREQKTFEGRTFPALDLDYRDVGGGNNHPVTFRDCTFEAGISVEHADVMIPLVFENCEIAGMEIEDAHFEYDVEVVDSTITAPVHAEESRFDRDCEFTDTTFTAETRLEEISCGDDTSFESVTFEEPVSFRGGTFSGKSNEMDDNASFVDATFAAAADFERVHLRSTDFTGATFAGPTGFEDARVDGDAWFRETTFADEARFAEATFTEDATFEGAAFEAPVTFQGAEFKGGARTLEDDVRFVDATFAAEADFSKAEMRYANYGGTTFAGDAHFAETWFMADADFVGATFRGAADFDEVRFVEDADFSEATFEAEAGFRGAEFRGHANQLEDNASFDGAVFEADADFSDAEFTSANFMRVAFAGTIDFTDARFDDRIDAMVLATDDDPYVDLTDATVHGGTITQPKDGWVRYDLTRASIGDIDLQSATDGDGQQLLDYFRFCNTVFDEFDGDEFDFSAHTGYLDRNDWVLHVFDDPTDRTYAVEMTPEVIETTYLNAKKSASAAGDMKAAGEFRVKRQQFARRKHLSIASDPGSGVGTRFRNGIRAAENAFLGITCGHGMRIFRIFAVFAIVPLLFAPLYAFGGPPFALEGVSQPESITAAFTTPGGQAQFFEILSFSYITFLTIGYGFNGPEGWAARIFAPFEVYLSVILGGLVLYALIKRSEM